MKITLLGRGSTHSVIKFIPVPQAMKTLDAKAAVDKEWEKLEKLPPLANDKSKEQK